MRQNSADTIQGPVLEAGNAVSPHTVKQTDRVAEFVSEGDVTCTVPGQAPTTTTVLAGARYAIGAGVTVITFAGTFNVS